MDLSSPRGSSFNNGIDPQLCSLSYARLDGVVRRVLSPGSGPLLTKLDIQSAHRIIPVHPDDRSLLGMTWQSTVSLDAALPFGLRLAPKIFLPVTDALLGVMIMYKNCVTSGVHYLNEFLFHGPPGSDECSENLAIALAVCSELGVRVARHKLEGPKTSITFFGIVINTYRSQLRLPSEKLDCLRECLAVWANRRCCTERELLSLIESMNHAAAAVRPGRVFLRRLIDLSKIPKMLHHCFASTTRRVRTLSGGELSLVDVTASVCCQHLVASNPSIRLRSDASSEWGCGAAWQRDWLQVQWSSGLAELL